MDAGEAIPDGDGNKPDLFVASDGTATAVWQKGTTNTLVIRAARRPPGGAWSSVETISPAWSYRPHIEGDIAGDITVSYTHELRRDPARHLRGRPAEQRRVGHGDSGRGPRDQGQHLRPRRRAQQRAGDRVLAGRVDQRAPRRAHAGRRQALEHGTFAEISGGTAGRLDLDERDRAAVDGTGLVTAAWIAGNKVLTAHRAESNPGWTAPTPPAQIDPGDGTLLHSLQIASNAFGRAVGTWSAEGVANRWSLRGPGPGTAWSSPKPIDGVPVDAFGLDVAVDDTGRVAYVWGAEQATNVSSLAVSTYGNPLDNPQSPAPPGAAPPAGGDSSSAGGGGGTAPPSGGSAPTRAKAALQGTPTTSRGVKLVVTMPAAGSARILFTRAGRATRSALPAAAFRRVGVVSVKLKKGRNVVRVRRVAKRKLARGKYRATITPKVAGRELAPVGSDSGFAGSAPAAHDLVLRVGQDGVELHGGRVAAAPAVVAAQRLGHRADVVRPAAAADADVVHADVAGAAGEVRHLEARALEAARAGSGTGAPPSADERLEGRRRPASCGTGRAVRPPATSTAARMSSSSGSIVSGPREQLRPTTAAPRSARIRHAST